MYNVHTWRCAVTVTQAAITQSMQNIVCILTTDGWVTGHWSKGCSPKVINPITVFFKKATDKIWCSTKLAATQAKRLGAGHH